MFKRVFTSLTFLVLLATAAYADPFSTSVTGTQVTVNYVEPSVNKTGTPLLDLAFTTIYYDMGAGPIAELQVVSSSVSGGGNVSQTIIVPVVLDDERDVILWATATDTSGNESVASPTSTERIDRLAPGAPQ